MNEKPRVETVEEFKLRIAAIIGGKSEQITGATTTEPAVGSPQKGCDLPESKTSKDALAPSLRGCFLVTDALEGRMVALNFRSSASSATVNRAGVLPPSSRLRRAQAKEEEAETL